MKRVPGRRHKAEICKPAKPEQIPPQVRLPRYEVRAIKIAAVEREQTISDFMLACFYAYVKLGKHAGDSSSSSAEIAVRARRTEA
jgi:hypothetical protein